MTVLGISCHYHDSAAAIIDDERLLFAIQEERLSRDKQDSRFPVRAIANGLEKLRITIGDIDSIVFYERPDIKMRRLWRQALLDWPNSLDFFENSMPYFYRYKMPVEDIIRHELQFRGAVEFCEHHRSHAAAAFFTSPFERAAVVTMDGVGEFETTTVYLGEGNSLVKVRSIHFPHSLGLFYSVFTNYLGFQVNEGEYKVMGLAPYGRPIYLDQIVGPVLRLNEDGSFHLNRKFFQFSRKDFHFNQALVSHLGIPPRSPDETMTSEHQNLAASV